MKEDQTERNSRGHDADGSCIDPVMPDSEVESAVRMLQIEIRLRSDRRVGWVLIGVTGAIDAPSAQIRPRELEPLKNGNCRWVHPGSLPDDLYPATGILLELYTRDHV